MISFSFILSVLLLAISVPNAVLAVISFRKRNLPGGTSLAWLLVTITIYSAGYAMELIATNEYNAHFWLHVEYFGVPFFPPLLVIAIWSILFQKKMSLSAITALFVIPVLTFFLHHTNDHHHLYYASVKFITRGPFTVLDLEKGPWYWVQTAYLNCAILICGIMSIMRFFRLKGQLKRLAGIIIISLLFPWAGHIIYITGANPYGIDTAPFSLSVTMFILTYAFYRQRMLDILPIAYDALFRNLPDGVLVVDENGLVVGHNASVEKILDMKINGIPALREVIPLLTETCDHAKIEGNCTIEKKAGGASKWIDIRGNIFQTHKNQQSRIITLRDITEMKMLELAIKANEKKMRDEIARMRNIQAALMPDFSTVKSYDITSIYLPAGDLSGDFIDGYFVDDETYQIVICDVMGHGLASAYLGMEIRSLFRAISPGKKSPAKILAEVNNTLTLDFANVLYFATAALVHIHLPTHRILYSSAGHPPALHRTARSEIIETGFTGALIGLTADNIYEDISLDFALNDFFLMYTDGVTESRKPETGEEFERTRLMKEFEHVNSSSRDVLHTIINAIFEFTDYASLEDDVSMICISRRD